MRMEVNLSALGVLMYVAMAAWLAAVGAYLARTRRLGSLLFASGFILMTVAFVVRWAQVGRPPTRNLFDVFLCLGVLVWPLWVFCERALGAKGPATAAFVGVVALFPAGFVFSAEPHQLPPALRSWLFVPHVATYVLAYVILILASAQALMVVFSREQQHRFERELATHRMVEFGFPLLTLGLILGAVWGQRAWGDYWNWDPKELWALATWLIYVGYFHFRAVSGAKRPRANAAFAIVGALTMVLSLLWVNLAGRIFPGLHVYAT